MATFLQFYVYAFSHNRVAENKIDKYLPQNPDTNLDMNPNESNNTPSTITIGGNGGFAETGRFFNACVIGDYTSVKSILAEHKKDRGE